MGLYTIRGNHERGRALPGIFTVQRVPIRRSGNTLPTTTGQPLVFQDTPADGFETD